MVTLSLDNVSVKLGQRPVVRDVSARFEAGTLVGVIGPNGAGKSSLIRAILALIRSEGRIALDDRDTARIGRAALARAMAYLPQGQTLHWPVSVERLVGLGRLPHLGPVSRISEKDTAAIERAMARADVLGLRTRAATELSGGERARVLLARALAVEAPVLIADEPLASLDPGHQIDVMNLLVAEARAGALVIAVLHDLTMAARYCDRLVLLDRGSLVADGGPGDVLTQDNLRDVYGVEAIIKTETGRPAVTTLWRSPPRA